jgi:hypothetical protein
VTAAHELDPAERRERRPERDDVHVVGDRRGPPPALRPRRDEAYRTLAGRADHRAAERGGGFV